MGLILSKNRKFDIDYRSEDGDILEKTESMTL